jgi:hypothetical protein
MSPWDQVVAGQAAGGAENASFETAIGQARQAI